MRKKVYTIWLLLVALIAGAWSVPSAQSAAMPQQKLDATSACDRASTRLTGTLANLPHVKGLIHDTCDFRAKMDRINKGVSEFDKEFIEDAITSNTLEIQTLQYTLDRTTNEEWRGLIMMMIDQHTSDLQQALTIAKKIGADTTPNLRNASVYPETPDYDLGMRRIDLVATFLDPLMAAGGGSMGTGTPTVVPTGTGVGTATAMDTGTAVGTATIGGSSASVGVAATVGTGTYDDTDPAWTYTGNWATYTGGGPYNNTLHFTSTMGDSAEVTFTGMSFTLFYTTDVNRGSIDVFVDGNKTTTINAYSASYAFQQTYTSPNLSSGDHTVRLVHAGNGAYIDIDAIQVIGPTQPGGTATATAVDTASPTLVPTETPTLVPTDTATLVATDTPTFVPTDTPSLVPSGTATTVPTGTSTSLPTGTATAITSGTPTGGGTGVSPDFDAIALDIIQEEHVMDLESEMAAERLVKNDEIRAFAKHSADVTRLHLLLLRNLKNRLFFNIMPPALKFQENYQVPRRFEPR